MTSGARARVARFAAIGGVMDFTIYIALSLAPLLAERRWGASSLTLGALPFTWAVVYSASAVFGGRFSDRVPRTSSARLGLCLVVASCVGMSRATAIWHLFAGMPLIALGMALFWPGLQAAIADESEPGTLSRNLSWFNVCWSAGKGLGVLTGGILLESLGRDGFLAAAGVAVLLILVMPRVPRGGGAGTALTGGEDLPPPRVRNAFLFCALAANFAAFGLGTTIVNHYPELNAAMGRGGFAYGLVAGGVFLSQTAAFAVLLLWRGWAYRAVPLLAIQVLAAFGAVCLVSRGTLPLVLGAVLLGAGFAFAYHASIYYSLHADVARGGRAGRHEAVLAVGNFLVPLLGGAGASALGRVTFPYLLAAGVVAISVAIQAAVLWRARPSPVG